MTGVGIGNRPPTWRADGSVSPDDVVAVIAARDGEITTGEIRRALRVPGAPTRAGDDEVSVILSGLRRDRMLQFDERETDGEWVWRLTSIARRTRRGG